MRPALLTNRQIVIVSSLLLATACVFPTNTYAVAGGLQVCEPSSTCEVGEFLFDDQYLPITTATCTITSKYPDASSFLTNQSMTGESDGWYGYTFTAPTTEGLYRTQVCCTSGSDYLCIDKGFEVQSGASVSIDNNAIASAVWGYSNRTLSSFGTLTRDIWLNSTRTLTSLTLDSSSTSSSTSIASDSDLDSIKKTVTENRLLLEELVNKPIIETSLEDDEADLGQKLEETKSVANQLYANTQYIRSQASSIISKWNSYSDEDLVANLQDLLNVNKSMQDSSSWLAKAWGWKAANDIESNVQALSEKLDSSLLDISTRGRSTYAYEDIKKLVVKLDAIEESIGSASEDTPDETLFGKLREVTRLANALDQQNADLRDLLASWDAREIGATREGLNSISRKVSPLNRIIQLRSYLSVVDSSVAGRDLKNKAFAVGGVIDANKKLLARNSDEAIAFTWLELGSIVFKSVIINPSSLIKQTAHLSYFLPPEIKDTHIKKSDDGVSVLYDVESGKMKVQGDFDLDPSETISVSVSTEDIWEVTPEQISSIKRQLDEYMKVLEGTAFYAQAITLKADIDVALEKVTTLQSRAITPEERIRAYRESMVELDKSLEMVDQMKNLVTEVSANSSLLAFVGGAQTFSVWGIAIIIIASVVFLATYIRISMQDKNIRASKKSKKQIPSNKHQQPPFVMGQTNWRLITGSAVGILIFGAVVSGVTAFVVLKTVSEKTVEASPEVLAVIDSKQPVEEKTALDKGRLQEVSASQGGQDIVRIEVVEGQTVKIFSEDSDRSEVLFNLKFSTEAIKLEDPSADGGEYIKVAIQVGEEGEDKIEGYVFAENIFTSENSLSHNNDTEIVDKQTETESDDTISEMIQLVLVGETPTGWLRVRITPRGDELTKVNTGQKFRLLEETTSWYKIELDDNTSGWVSKEYTSLVN